MSQRQDRHSSAQVLPDLHASSASDRRWWTLANARATRTRRLPRTGLALTSQFEFVQRLQSLPTNILPASLT